MTTVHQGNPNLESADRVQSDHATWWVRLGPERQGPMSLETMRQRWSAGVYSRWHEGSQDEKNWHPVGVVLESASPASDPLMPEQDQNNEDTHENSAHDSFAWEELSDASAVSANEAVPIASSASEADVHTRVALASGGVLLVAVCMLPVVVNEGRAGAWWSWPGDVPGIPFALMLALWAGLGAGLCVLAIFSRRLYESLFRLGFPILGIAWLGGWLGVFGGPALALVAPAWLLAAPGMAVAFVGVGFNCKQRAILSAASGVAVLCASCLVALTSEALTALPASAFVCMGCALIGTGSAIHFIASRRVLQICMCVAVGVGLLGTFAAGYQGAAALRIEHPILAGAQYVRSAIFVSGLLALVGLNAVFKFPMLNRTSSDLAVTRKSDRTKDESQNDSSLHPFLCLGNTP